MNFKNTYRAFSFLVVMMMLKYNALSQLDSLSFDIESSWAISTNSFLSPHIAFNKFGKLNPNQQTDGYFELSLKYPILNKNNWKIETGVDFVTKPDINTSFFHKAFFNIKYKKFDVRIGKNPVFNNDYWDEMGSGSFFQSQNTRTITKFGFGFWEYTQVPFFKYLKFRSAFELGLLESGGRPVKNAFINEKFFYLSTDKLFINPFVGLSHVVLFGGTNEKGLRLPDNLIESVFALASTKSDNPSDQSNTSGAHFALFDLGFNFPFGEKNNLKLFFQQPMSTEVGYARNLTRTTDYILGVELKMDHPVFKKFMYENINTVEQGGEGMPDRYINGKFFSIEELRNIENYSQFVEQNYNVTVELKDFDEFEKFLRKHINQGYDFGGRGDYYNNDQYPYGNTFHKMSLGTPLFLTKDRIQSLYNVQVSDVNLIANNRVLAHHFALSGTLKKVDFILKYTVANNLGTYSGKFYGRRSGSEIDYDYYFFENVNDSYISLHLTKEYNKTKYSLTLEHYTNVTNTAISLLVNVLYKIH